MPIVSSGQLALSTIRDEFGAGTTSNVSLRTLSAAAGLSAPDGFNEFYGLSSFSPSNYFDILSGTGNASTLTMTGTNFAPQAGFHVASGSHSYSDSALHIQNFGVAKDGQSRYDGNTSFGYLSNGITVANDSDIGTNANGQTQWAALFGNLTQYTTGGITSLVNRDVGVGFFKTGGTGSFVSNWFHNLNSKPHFCIFMGDWGFITMYYDSTSYTTYLKTSPSQHYGAFQWSSLTDAPLFSNMMFKTVDSSKFVVTAQSDSFWDAVSTDANNYAFYAHPVADFSYTGFVNFSTDDCIGGTTQTVNIGARPKIVFALPVDVSNAGDFKTYFHIDGMPSGQSAQINAGYQIGKGLPITITSTGFTIGNKDAEDMSKTCGQRVYKILYYAII